MFSDTTKKEPATKENLNLRSGLYLLATPIGNLRDVTLRALDVLQACDVVVCEDTRQTGKLLRAYGLEKPLLVYNDHASDKQRVAVLGKISADQVVVLVSDAGMPLISDPGYKLVREVLEQGLYVTSLPGANAPLMALQLSGLPSDSFSFAGFLPAKDKARRDFLKGWGSVPSSLVFFESAPRLQLSLLAMSAVLGDRPAAVLRELTKLYEEGRRGRLSELAAYYEQEGAPKGEIVIVVSPPERVETLDAEIVCALEKALEYLTVKQASALIAELFGRQKRELYDWALQISKNKNPS